MSQLISLADFTALVEKADSVQVACTPPAGRVVYFEISKAVALLKADDLARDRIPFEMDCDRFLWIGDPTAALRLAVDC